MSLWQYLHAMEDWDFHFRKAELQYKGERYIFARENYKRALDLRPDLFQAANRLAEIHIILNKKRTALDYLRLSLKIRDNQSDIHTLAGELCDFFGYRDESFKHLSRAVELDPDNVRAHFSLVRYYISTGNKTMADKHFDICYEAGRKEGDVYFQQGLKEETEGNTDKAIISFAAAIEKNPAHIAAYFKLVEIYRRLNRTNDAIAVLERLQKVRPDHQNTCRYLGHLYFVKPAVKNRKKYYLNLAVKNLEKALELDPKDQDARFLLSDVHRYMGDFEKARDVQNREPAGTPP